MAAVNIVDMLKTYKSSEGVSLFQHLCNLFNKMLNDHSTYANFDQFEILSDLVKRNQFNYSKPRTAAEVNTIEEPLNEYSEWIKQIVQILEKNKVETEKGLKEVTNAPAIPNVVAQARLFEWAGVAFGEQETYLISKSLAKLALKTEATQLRFWGKILASQQDYYVAEGVVSNKYNDDYPREYESKGTGVNKMSYWVAHNVLDEWIELPVISPEHLKAARLIKYMFTGDLNHKIVSYPVFPGLEKHLLKAQIVRITNATVIEPKGLHKLNDETNELEFEEEYKHPEFTELTNPETWVHTHPDILKAGRISHLEPDLPEEEKQAKLDEMNTEDPVNEKLKGINEDKPFEPFEQGWAVKTVGETQQFNLVGKEEGVTSYAVVVLKNLRWPGNYTVANNKTFQSIYVGYGFKSGQPSFFPNQPQDIMEEAEDIEEQPEPNPKNEIVEPDSDDLKKKDGDGDGGDGGDGDPDADPDDG